MKRTDQDLLSTTALTTFRLNGLVLTLAEELARPAGLTAAWWQVLGAVLGEPRSVSQVARDMGLTRQSVQRIADLLADRGLVEYRANPNHARAKLVAATDDGLAAVRRIDPRHADAATALAKELGTTRLAEIVDGLTDLTNALVHLETRGWGLADPDESIDSPNATT